MTSPFMARWSGDSFVPWSRHRKRMDEQYVVGADYALLEYKGERSARSHRHYFACIRSVWENLPDQVAEMHPTPEHLRKWALIKCGYCDVRSLVCTSKAEAARVGAFIKPSNEHSVVIVNDGVVREYTPQSQRVRAMSNETFQKSKTDVLELLSSMVGTTPDELQRNTE